MNDAAFRAAQLELFRHSVIKQAKWRELSAAAGATAGLDALDLGSDNGVISLLFREQGGRWTSADLTDETVASIRRMVGERVVRLEGELLPFEDAAFDLIVVVDLLEHVANDRLLLAEIARCMRPGARAVLNVPHLKRASLLRPLREAIGLTDQWHGHLRAGYTLPGLASLLPSNLRLVHAHTYARAFSHLLDTALNFTFLRAARARSGAKGMVVNAEGVHRRGTRVLALAYPLMRAFAALDALLAPAEGYALLAVAERLSESTAPYAPSSLRRNSVAE
jgi:SAM-dependent methyltransferase